MNFTTLVGAEGVERAGRAMLEAATQMQAAASRIEFAFEQHRIWEEEYLTRIETIVNRELDFYADKK